MPLGARDILLVMRARDDASRIINQVGAGLGAMSTQAQLTGRNMMIAGAGLTAIGAGFIAAGAAGLDFFHTVTMEAVEYQRTAALTLTQIDDTGVALQDVAAIGKRVAKDIPAPFDQMQQSLFDIFSSMNVNLPQAENLLRQFSKGAVAGQVDVQAAARATIAIMNSFQIPVEQVNRVMDIQFQLVRKGVGTYQEFAETIGRVTPAAVAAGQSVESMTGALAFLTRNGLSTAMAATSASRAFELLTQPDVTRALQDIGVKVKDSSGEFLQMKDIVRQLVYDKGWGKLTGPELKAAFKETFGTGSMQARRFFDLVIPNFEQFASLTDDMQNSAGAMDAAYNIMFDQPASKMQQLQNNFAIFREEIGERLIPMFEKLLEIGQSLLDWWDSLSPSTQDLIIKVTALAAGLAVVVGVVTAVVGVVLIFAGAAAAAGVTLTTVGVVIAAVVAGFVALVAIVYNVIEHWDTLVGWFNTARETFDGLATPFKVLIGLLAAPIVVIGALVAAIIWLVKNFDTVKEKASEVWSIVAEAAVTAFNTVKGAVETVWGWITGTAVPAIVGAWDAIMGKIQEFIAWVQGTAIPFVQYWVQSVLEQWNLFAAWWDEHVGPVITAISELFSVILQKAGEYVDAWESIFQFVWDIIQNVWTAIKDYILNTLNEIWNIIQTVWGFISPFIMETMSQIWNVIQTVWDIIQNVVKGAIDFIKWAIENWGDNIVDTIQIIWDGIVGFIQGALQLIQGIIQIVTGVISGDWGKVWEGIKNVFGGIWNAIWAIVSSVIEQIANVIRAGMDVVAHFMGTTWENIWNTVKTTWENIKNAISTAINAVSDFIRNGINGWRSVFDNFNLFDIGKKIIDGLWNGIKSGFDTIKNGLGSLTSLIPDWKGPPATDAQLLRDNGRLIMESLQLGLADGWQDVRRQLSGYNPMIQGSISTGVSGPVGSFNRPGPAVTVSAGAIQMYISIDSDNDDVKRSIQEGVQAALAELEDTLAGYNDGTP